MSDIPSSDGNYVIPALIYGLLTAFALLFGVWLSQGALSPAHTIGIVAFLSLPEPAWPLMTWAIAIGGFAGALALVARRRQERTIALRDMGQHVLMVTSRVTLSFFAASQVYIVMDGVLPLDRALWQGSFQTSLALLIYIIVYVTVYCAIFALEVATRGQNLTRLLRDNLALLGIILILPIPFAILSAEISRDLTHPIELMAVFGLVTIVIGLHALSRSERRTQRQLDELKTLSIVTRSMRAHLEPESLLRTIYVQVSQLFGVSDFSLIVFDKNRSRLAASIFIIDGVERSLTMDRLRTMDDYVLIDHVMRTSAPLILGDNLTSAAAKHGIHLTSDRLHSWMGVPLLIGGQQLGVMAVAQDSSFRLFSAKDLRLLSIIADSVSIAVENAQLFEQQSQRVDQMVTLNNIAALLSGTLSPDTVLDTVISSASAISDANAVVLHLRRDEATQALPLVRYAGVSDRFIDHAPTPLLDAQVDSRQIIAVEDIAADGRAADRHGILRAEDIAAFVELPLAVGDSLLGVLVLYFAQVRHFSEEWLELLKTFATQAAQAITNARVYTTTDEALQRSVEQLLTLASIGRELTSTIDLKTICDIVLRQSLEATEALAGVVALYETEASPSPTLMSRSSEVTLTDDLLARGAGSQALTTGQVQRVDDISAEDARLTPSGRSQLAVPIMQGETSLGFLLMERNRSGGFSEEDSHFASQLANQAVIAIDNARLFKRITEARDRLQVILDTMEEAIILIDRKGQVALANPRMHLLDVVPGDVLGRHIDDLVEDPALDFAQRLGFSEAGDLQRLVTSMATSGWDTMPSQRYTRHHEQGMRTIQRYVIPVLDDASQTIGALLVFYDKTDEHELERAREELTRMIVHDLRSPLTAIMTSLKLLQDYIPSTNDAYSLIQTTTDSSRRAVRKLLDRVDSLLDISKIQSGRMALDQAHSDFTPIVDAVRDELSPLAHELEIAINADLNGNLPALNIDADKIERLLLNLVDNALKYSPMKSDVIIRAHGPGQSGAADGYVRIDVTDHGPGVPDDYKESLFESFTQVEGRAKVRRGVGLGLSFCRLVTEAHGGRIWIEDNQPSGSIFAFTLPLATGEGQPEESEEDVTAR